MVLDNFDRISVDVSRIFETTLLEMIRLDHNIRFLLSESLIFSESGSDLKLFRDPEND